MRHVRLMIGATLLVLLGSTPAWAKLEYLKELKGAYPAAGKATCVVCHVKPFGGKELNLYGQTVAQQKAQAPALADVLRAIEQEDADSDGTPNADEINAGTNPGDPASKPAAP